MNEFRDKDQQQLQRMATTMEAIIAEQQRMNCYTLVISWST